MAASDANWRLTLIVIILTLVAAVSFGAWSLFGSRLELSPTPVAVGEWDSAYQGQHWVRVDGTLSPEDLRWQQKSPDSYVGYVAIRAKHTLYTPGDPNQIRIVLELQGSTLQDLIDQVKTLRDSQKPLEGLIALADERPPIESLHYTPDTAVLRLSKP